MVLPLLLGQSFQLESRISQNAVKNTASVVFPVSVSLISEMNHLVDKFQRFDDVLVARSHALTLSGKGLIPRYHGNAIIAEFSHDWISSNFVPESKAWQCFHGESLILRVHRLVPMLGLLRLKILSDEYSIHASVMKEKKFPILKGNR